VPLAVAPVGPATAYAPYDLAPGTSVAAGLLSGDLTLSAIGTVTYRDGAKLWAFGHPFEASGPRSLPLLDAYVFSIIDNPIGFEGAITYKLASAGRPVGTLTNDGIGAIAGQIGSPPPTIPLTVFARDLTSRRTRTVRSQVSDERRLDLGSSLGLGAEFGLSEAIVSVLRAAPNRMTASTCVRIRIRQARKPLGFCQRYFDPFAMLVDVDQATSLIDGYKFGPLDIRDVSIRAGVRTGIREAFILGATAPRRVRPGQRIRVRMSLRHSRAGRFSKSFVYRVPRGARPGLRTLTVRGSGSEAFGLDAIFAFLFGEGGGSNRPPKSIDELSDRIAGLRTPDGIRATLARKGRGRIVLPMSELKIRGKTEVPLIVSHRAGRD
jgi:hypothetical protein